MQNRDCQKLRNCPFCGGEAKIISYKGCHHIYHRCKITLFEITSDYYDSKESIVDAWNRRANDV